MQPDSISFGFYKINTIFWGTNRDRSVIPGTARMLTILFACYFHVPPPPPFQIYNNFFHECRPQYKSVYKENSPTIGFSSGKKSHVLEESEKQQQHTITSCLFKGRNETEGIQDLNKAEDRCPEIVISYSTQIVIKF